MHDDTTTRTPFLRSLEPLFQPRSVAIIGASSTPFKQGNVSLKYLVKGGFQGQIFPVNPSGGEIEGLHCYKSIAEIDAQIDCALFVIPAPAVISAMHECAKKGVRAAIIGANGFAELGTEEGIARQAELTRIAREHAIRVVGPNTNGIWNATDRLSLGYNTSHGDEMTPGPVSIAAHSGALFNSIAPSLRRFGAGLSKFVPVGNEADLDMLDFLEYYIEDPATGVIGLIVEALNSGARLRELAGRARAAGKSIVALKLGRSEAGAGAALAHSSRLAGSARAYEALFHDCGIMQVKSIEAMAGTCALLCEKPRDLTQEKCGLIAVTTSGGGGGLIADHAADFDIPLAGNADGSWTGKAAELIKTFDRAGPIFNPVDGGNLAGWPRLEQILEALEADGMNGPVLFFGHMLPQARMDKAVQEILARRKQRTGSPVVCVAPGGLRPEVEAAYGECAIPVFADMGTCFAALASLYESMFAPVPETDVGNASFRLPPEREAEIARRLVGASGRDWLTEYESASIISAAGIQIVGSQIAASAQDAVRIAESQGWPVVLKGITKTIAHKAEAGLVITGLQDEAALVRAFTTLQTALDALGEASDGHIIVQKMIAGKLELIVGIVDEPPLGKFLLTGIGGIHTEIFDEIALLHIPASPDAIDRHIGSGKIGALLQKLSPDGSAANALSSTLAALQTLALRFDDEISAIDLNPVIVTQGGAIAVDALVGLKSQIH